MPVWQKKHQTTWDPIKGDEDWGLAEAWKPGGSSPGLDKQLPPWLI